MCIGGNKCLVDTDGKKRHSTEHELRDKMLMTSKCPQIDVLHLHSFRITFMAWRSIQMFVCLSGLTSLESNFRETRGNNLWETLGLFHCDKSNNIDFCFTKSQLSVLQPPNCPARCGRIIKKTVLLKIFTPCVQITCLWRSPSDNHSDEPTVSERKPVHCSEKKQKQKAHCSFLAF